MGEGVRYPRAEPYSRYYFESPAEGSGPRFGLSIIAPVVGTGPSGLYRAGGIGGEVRIRLTEKLNLGLAYTYNPIREKMIFHGHHLESFIELPKRLKWGRWRLGAIAEVSNLRSWEETRVGGGIIGIFVGVDVPIVSFGSAMSISLDFKSGMGVALKDYGPGFFILGGLKFNFMDF